MKIVLTHEELDEIKKEAAKKALHEGYKNILNGMFYEANGNKQIWDHNNAEEDLKKIWFIVSKLRGVKAE